MIEQALMEYTVNALWQVPLLAGGAWLLLRMVRPGPRMQHRVWLAVLGLAVLLPVHGMGRTDVLATEPQPITVRIQENATWREKPALPKTDWRRTGRPWLQLSPRVRSVRLAAHTAHWLVRLYVAMIAFALFRIARAWRCARHLVEHSRETTLRNRDRAALEDYCRRLGVKPPQLRESGEVPSSMIVGVTAPVLLLPEGFARHTEDEVRAALCHELAHIKRRDYLVNAICQLAALPVIWHPVTYGVQQCIRRTREMVCDAMAAQEMRSEIRYAKCLLALAQSMLGGHGMAEQAQFLGLFSSNILEERVMRLVETKTMSVRAKAARVASGAALMIATTSIAAMFHVMPTMAQSKAGASPDAAQNAPAGSQSQPQDWVPIGSLPALTVHQDPQPAPAGQRRIEKQLKQRTADARRRASEATAKLNSPAFKQQIADAQRQASEATAKLNSPAFKQQIADGQRQASEAMAKFNSPEFKQQMADLQKRLQRDELQRRNEEASPKGTRLHKHPQTPTSPSR
jgi:beta-lactamase regulating signal transducer with metallopeptidase domain